jgi:GNAT superfamily N-acetyltransferase
MQVVKGNEQDIDACLSIAEELPQYFDEKGIATMSKDLREHRLFVAKDSDQVVGFATIRPKSSQSAEISWMAVKLERQHQRVGSLLIDYIADDLRVEGIKLLEVKTLAADAEYAPYGITRRFYEKNSFIHLETIEPYPEWEPGNPCAIYVRAL